MHWSTVTVIQNCEKKYAINPACEFTGWVLCLAICRWKLLNIVGQGRAALLYIIKKPGKPRTKSQNPIDFREAI
jgi:hypothetical protein